MSLFIIVDTSVARACGRGHIYANSPAPQCVNALAAISNGNMMTAMSRDLKEEWHRHAGPYARRWLGNMIARKRFAVVNDSWGGESLVVSEVQGFSDKKRLAVLKDLHLVSLAMLTDKRILSLDDSQKELLAVVASKVKVLRSIHWANPKNVETQRWLLAGAGDEKSLYIVGVKVE